MDNEVVGIQVKFFILFEVAPHRDSLCVYTVIFNL